MKKAGSAVSADKKDTLRLLRILYIRMEEELDNSMKEYEITSAQSNILGYLLDHEEAGLNATGIHRQMHLSRASISVTIKKLRNKGFLEVLENPKDDRKKQIVLTEKARGLHKEMENSFKTMEERIYHEISDEEIRSAAKVLQKMYDNLKTEKGDLKYGKSDTKPGKAI